MIKQILVKDFSSFPTLGFLDSGDEIESAFLTQLSGKEWKRVRSIISHTFTSQKMKSVFSLMTVCNKVGVDHLKKISETSQKFDPKIFWGQYNIDIIAKCCFATDLNAFESEDNLFLTHVQAAFKPRFFRFLTLATIPSVLIKKLKICIANKESLHFFANMITHILENREKNPMEKVNDYLQLLAESREEEKPEKKSSESNNNIGNSKLSQAEIIANSVIFLLAGYETTSSLLTFACFELARNKDLQDRLRQEVTENDIEDYQIINELPYLDAVIKETLRMYPPVVGLNRRLKEKYNLNDSTVLEKGTTIQIPVYSLHRDPKYHPNPEEFDPERFLPPRNEQIKPYTYLPFGAGPRICVGMRFGQLNAKLALASLIKYFYIYPIESTPKCPQFNLFSFLLNAKPFQLGISSRF